MLSSLPQNPELDNIFVHLRDKELAHRSAAVGQLSAFLLKYPEYVEEVLLRITEALKNSENVEYKLSCIEIAQRAPRVIRETQVVLFVQRIMPFVFKQLNFGESELHAEASQCVGALANIGGSNVTHLVQSHVDDAIRWLIDNDDKKKLQAVLVLRQLCKAAPIIAFNKLIEKYYKNILYAAGDNKTPIREAAADCLAVFLSLLAHRESQLRQDRFEQCYKQALVAFQSQRDSPAIHMALLVLKALLLSFSSLLVGPRAQKAAQQVKKVVLNYRLKNETRAALIQVLPMLAKADPKIYAGILLKESTEFLLSFFKKKSAAQKHDVLLALGSLSIHIPATQFAPYATKVIECIENELKRSNPNQNSPRSLVTCIGMLTEQFGKTLLDHLGRNIVDFIDRLFFFGLCHELIETLAKLSKIEGAVLKKVVQIRLLHAISRVLTDSAFQFPVAHLLALKHKSQEKDLFTPKKSIKANRQNTHERQSMESDSILQSISSEERNDYVAAAAAGLFTHFSARTPDLESQLAGMSGIHQEGTPSLLSQRSEPRFEKPSPMEISFAKESLKVESMEMKKAVQSVKAGINTYLDSLAEKDRREAKLQMEIVALNTLGNFDFADFASSIVKFVQEIVVHFLKNPNPSVRKEAIKTGCSLTLRPNVSRVGGAMRRLITDILDRFLQVAMTDQEDKIRYAMLKYLNPQFDAFLASHQNLQRLFRCLNDPYVKVRKSVVAILARLVPHNAALIHSKLSNLLAELLSRLEHSTDLRGREESAFLLAALIRNSHAIAAAHASTIASVLLDKLVDSEYSATSSFITAVIEAFGELAKSGGYTLQPHLHTLVPLLMKHMRNQSFSSRRKMAINTLTLVLQNTCYVVKPYFRYPELIYDIRNLVQSESSQSIRNAAFRLIGTLGALDPHTFKQALLQSSVFDFSMVEDDLFQSVQFDEFKNEILNSAQTNQDRQRHVQAAMIALGGGITGQPAAAAPAQPITNNLQITQQKAVVPQNQPDPLTQALQQIQLHSNTQSSTDPSKADNIYDMTAITVLMRVLVDPTLADRHSLVLSSLEYIFKKLGSHCAPFVPLIVPSALQMIESFPEYRPRLLQQLTMLVDNVREKIAPILGPILRTAYFCLDQIRDPPPEVTLLVLELIRKLEECVSDQLSSHLNILLPKLLATVERTHTNEKVARCALESLRSLKTMLDQYLFLVVPTLLRIASSASRDLSTRERSINVLEMCVGFPRFEEYTSDVIHTLLKIVETRSTTLVRPAYELLREMARRMKAAFTQYLPLLNKIAAREKQMSGGQSVRFSLSNVIHHYHHTSESAVELWFDRQKNIQEFHKEASQLQSDAMKDAGGMGGRRGSKVEKLGTAPLKTKRRREINVEELIKKFDTSNLNLKDDWVEWLKNTSVQLLRDSPSHILFACSSVAQVYPPMAADLYNVAFMSVWKVLIDMHKEFILRNLYKAIGEKNTPNLIHQTLLNLIEYMEHDNQVPLIRPSDFSELAQRCNAYAKALRYREQHFETNPQQKENIEKLISINYALNQPEAARGVLVFTQKKYGINMNEDWYQQLRRWNDALLAYKVKQERAKGLPGTIADTGLTADLLIGKMQCYQALSEWDELAEAANQYWDAATADIMRDGLVYKEEEKSSRVGSIGPHEIGRPELPTISTEQQRVIAELSASAAWNLGSWMDLERHLEAINTDDSYEKFFYKSLLAIQKEDYSEFQISVSRARSLLDNRFTTLLSESYSRAYSLILELQHLKELEEIAIYKRHRDNLELQENLKQIWRARLKHVKRDIDIWEKSLALRSVVLSPAQDQLDEYLEYSDMCRESGRLKICGQLLTRLKDQLPAHRLTDKAKVDFATLRLMHAMGHQKEALQQLSEIVAGEHEGEFVRSLTEEVDSKLRAEFYLQLGLWEKEINVRGLTKQESRIGRASMRGSEKPMIEESAPSYEHRQEAIIRVLENLKQATELDPSHYIAWHNYAMMNLEVLTNEQAALEKDEGMKRKKRFEARHTVVWQESGSGERIPKRADSGLSPSRKMGSVITDDQIEKIRAHREAAVAGFIRAIALGKSDITKTLQDTLRLLKLWFNFSESDCINSLIKSSFEIIDVKAWLAVTPQLLARLDIHKQTVQATLIELFERIVKMHPQAVIYPLSVLAKESSERRRAAAERIMDSMRQHSPTLVDQIDVISNELVRIAILLPQQWSEAIEEAWRLYFANHDALAMISHFKPLHELMKQPPETLSEISFHQAYAAELQEAQRKLELYEMALRRRTQSVDEMEDSKADNLANMPKGGNTYHEELFLKQAWDSYITVFKRLGLEYPNNHVDPHGLLEMESLSPKLSQTRNCEVVVPGFFRTRNTVRIAHFGKKLTVFTRTKRQPKKISIFGADSKQYIFLLKGHEDIRQDERAMQLFGLVNTLLARDSFSSGKDLSIQRYPAIPLSFNAGLIGWVPNTDTLYELIREYRKCEQIVSNVEFKMIEQMCQQFDKCCVIQKVEIFKHALENTIGQDLQRMLWMRSANSEIWLERRTNYTRSHAVMCMVGHVLGLGDRHPSNIMLDRFSGKLVHIDFGDCFEIAMRREKFPEKVPFRLTRMMVKAMEISGIEGNFRKTAENTMRVLRQNKESLMAVLEAFVYDPLMSFHLLTAKYLNKGGHQEKEEMHRASRKSKKIVQQHTYMEKSLIETYNATFTDRTRRSQRDEDQGEASQDLLNKTTQSVMSRISSKLNGTEFGSRRGANDVETQVDLLINQAMSHENLAASYIGWCPYW